MTILTGSKIFLFTPQFDAEVRQIQRVTFGVVGGTAQLEVLLYLSHVHS